MRRKDREVTNPEEIESILRRCRVCRIAMQDEEGLYILPLSYGYEMDNGCLTLYFHGAKEGRKIRAGKGTMRNRKYRTPVSVLIVVKDDERAAPIFKSASNLPGVQIEAVGNLSAAILAPGGDAGRLTVYTESAFAKIGEW